MSQITLMPTLTDEAVLSIIRKIAFIERRQQALFLACMSEIERRGLYRPQGYSSLFDFCLRDLRLSEDTACRRIYATRAASRFPEIYSLIADGAVSLTAIALIGPMLTSRNAPAVLQAAQGASLRAARRIAAELQHDGLDSQSRLRPDKLQYIAGGGLFVGFAAGSELETRLLRLKELLRGKFPGGKLADIIGAAVDYFLAHHDPDRKKPARARAQRQIESRRIPQWVKDSVWARDEGRCAFVGIQGRCAARERLEFDHAQPWALGGSSDDPANIRLLCRPDHRHCTELVFGKRTAPGGGAQPQPPG